MPARRRASESPCPGAYGRTLRTMADARPRLALRARDAIDLGSATDFHILLRAIDASMPADATLMLEGAAIAELVAAFLRAREAATRREVASFGVPRAPAYHLPL